MPAPRAQGDPWARPLKVDESGNAVFMAQMTAMMAAMQRTIDALTAQLGTMQSGSGGKANHGKDSEDMPVMHHKDVDKPSKFSGQNLSTWSIDFMNFLGRKNAKWKTILQTIQNVSQKPFDDKGYEHLKSATKIDEDEVLNVYKEQLYEYLKSYTGGDVHTVVISNNPENAFESWRRMCDQGNSIRERPLRDERRAIFHPKQASAEGLVKAIAEWEKRLHAYVLQRPLDVLSPEDKIMCLEDICPEPIQKFLADQHMLGVIQTYEEYKDAIDRYFYQEKRWSRKKAGIHQCSGTCRDESGWCSTSQGYTETPVEAGNDDENQEDDGEHAWLPGVAGEVAGAVMAIMKGGKGKGKFGKGKGKGNDGKGNAAKGTLFDKDAAGKGGKGGGKRSCYECGEEGHLARECPVRKNRVDNGGPAIMKGNPNAPSDKGKGKGKQGWYPSSQQWMHMYPSRPQWQSN